MCKASMFDIEFLFTMHLCGLSVNGLSLLSEYIYYNSKSLEQSDCE